MTAAVVVVAATGVVSTLLISGGHGLPPLIPQGDQHGYLRSGLETLCGMPLKELQVIPDVVFPYPGSATVCADCRRTAIREDLTTSAAGFRRVPGTYRDGRGFRGDVLRAVMELGGDLSIALGDRLVGWHVDSQDCVDLGGHVLRALVEVEGATDAATLDAAAGVVARFVDRYPQWRDPFEVAVVERRQLRAQTRPRPGVNGEPQDTVPWYAQPGRAWALRGPHLTER